MDNEQQDTRHGGWHRYGVGIAVVAIGVIFLLGNFGIRMPFLGMHNGWALFILVAAVPMLLHAADRYRSTGKVDAVLLQLLLSASAPLLVAAFFLLDLSWDLWWPLFVIYGGLWVMLGSRRRQWRQT